jgi:hypothetical protein
MNIKSKFEKDFLKKHGFKDSSYDDEIEEIILDYGTNEEIKRYEKIISEETE